MSLRFLEVLAPAKLEDLDLFPPSVRYDGCFDLRAGHEWRANAHVVSFANHQYFVKGYQGAYFGQQCFYAKLLARGNPVLLSAGSDNRVHFSPCLFPAKGRNYRGLRHPTSKPPVLSCAARRGPVPDLNPDMLSVLAPIAEEMSRVDLRIRERLDSDVPLVREVADYIVAGGGKRLRPALLLLASSAAGYRGDARYELAAVVEFIHTATLLHDDVVDDSRLRRGRDTANANFGNAAAVLVGDFLYSRAFQMMVGVNSMRVMRVLADATNTIAEGEVLQLMNCRDPGVDEVRYLEVIRRKTAKLFEAAARLGAILGGLPSDQEDGLAAYGMHLGTAFQLIDDVLDYSGEVDSIGKSLGDDLAEGKPTLPLIRVLDTGTPQQAEIVRRAIVSGGRDDFAGVLEAIRATGALEYTRQVAQGQANAAWRAIDGLQSSIWKETLLELSAFSVARQF